METPHTNNPNKQNPDPEKPPLQKRTPGGYIKRGIADLEAYANDPANHLPPEKLAELIVLEGTYASAPREPEHRNTLGVTGKVDTRLEVSPLDPNVPARELGGAALGAPIYDQVKGSLATGRPPEN